jgi:hypothetical protein
VLLGLPTAPGDMAISGKSEAHGIITYADEECNVTRHGCTLHVLCAQQYPARGSVASRPLKMHFHDLPCCKAGCELRLIADGKLVLD